MTVAKTPKKAKSVKPVDKSLPAIHGKSGQKPVIDILRALKLRLENGLTLQEIGNQLGVSKQAVSKALQRFRHLIDNPDAIRAYEQNRPKLYSATEMLIVEQMNDPKVLKKASLGNYAYALDKIYNINRLETGKSTSNVAYQDITASLEEVERQIEVYENKDIEGALVSG